MGTKVIVFICCLFICGCATSMANFSGIENEKKYAVAYCLSNSYPHTEFSSDASYISGAYLQKGEFGLDMYEDIRDFVSIYREKLYVSKHDRNLNIMQCIDLYESEELEQLIKKIANKSNLVPR